MEKEFIKNEELGEMNLVEQNAALLDADGVFSRVDYHANSISGSSLTSGVVLKTGYRALSGTLAANAQTDAVIFEAGLSQTISFVANLSLTESNSWTGRNLIVSAGRDYANNCYRIVIYNPTNSAVSLSLLRAEYIAIQR